MSDAQKQAMSKPNLLVICPVGHYALRYLDALADAANIDIGETVEFAREHGPAADVLLYSGLGGHIVPFAEVWQYTPSVKWVHSLSAGVEKFMVPAFIESPVPLTNARGVYKRSLAEFAILGILFFYKRVRRLLESQKAHHWDEFKVEWAPDKILGVVGYGEIGRECALLAKALGMKIYAVRRKPQQSSSDPILDRVFAPAELHEMLSQVDAVVAAAPLTPETRHMLSDAEFAAMKRSAIVINVGRGPVIHEEALIRALQQGKIGGAALDVFEAEPLAVESPLWDMDNVLISPHCTDRTQNPDWLDLSMQFFIANFNRFRKGEPLENIVDKKAGY
jgi:phosphoglycerate dehydrogenase-like enzyme